MPLSIELNEAEAAAVLNALNYFANAVGADECSTLLGLEQAAVQALHERLREAYRHRAGAARRS